MAVMLNFWMQSLALDGNSSLPGRKMHKFYSETKLSVGGQEKDKNGDWVKKKLEN